MIKPFVYVPHELRFPKRLEKVRRTGVEIAQSLGQRFEVGGGRPLTVRFQGFEILYFTPFNQPKDWLRINWEDRNVRLYLNGLMICCGLNCCLDVLWNDTEQDVRWFRIPREDDWDGRLRDWDRRLRQVWKEDRRRGGV
jgi:hypothetical protein